MADRDSLNPDRADPRTLVPTARRLYKEGKSCSEVLTAIYGVDLPREAYLVFRDYVREEKPLQASWLLHPWELMIPFEQGGPKLEIDPHSVRMECRAFAQAPQVLLLGNTGYNDATYGASLFGYDLDALRAGRTTIVGLDSLRDVPESGAEFQVFGPSLLDFFHELISRYHGLMNKWIETDVFTYTHDDLEEIADQLRGIEALQREVAGRS